MRTFAPAVARDRVTQERRPAERRRPDPARGPSQAPSQPGFASIAVARRGGGGPPDAGNAPEQAPAPSPPAPVEPEAVTAPEGPAPPGPAPESEATAPSVAPALSWAFVKTHTWDALWFFCGEHPAGFSTRILLRAGGFADPTALTWSIPRGSDKIAFVGTPTGPEVHVTSTAGSALLDDITVRVTEGVVTAGAPSHDGTLTVRKPHRLLPRFIRHHANCPPFERRCGAGAAAHWTELGYRIVDNVGGTIVGATVNENFPSAKADDQPNSWWRPVAAPSTPDWRNTDGTFIDYWWVFGDPPLPVNPGDPHDNDSVDRAPHEFYIGSPNPGKGCRVQTHTAHRYLGHTVHENIASPAP